MNKAELTNRLAKETGMPLSTTKMFLETFREVVQDSIEKQEEIDFAMLFKLDYVKVNPREGRNPRTGDVVYIPGGIKPRLKLVKKLSQRK